MSGGIILKNVSVGYEDELPFDEAEHRIRVNGGPGARCRE
jgi:hypothetical protein